MVLKLIKLQNKMTAFHGQEGMQQISANQIRLLLWRLDLDGKVKTPEQKTPGRCFMLRHIWSRVDWAVSKPL